MKKTPTEIDEHCLRPGPEGTLWRLVKHWNPDGIGDWMVGEHVRGTPAPELGRCLGELMAAAVFGFGQQTDNPRDAMLGPHGIVQSFQQALQSKVDRHRIMQSEGGVFLPPAV